MKRREFIGLTGMSIAGMTFPLMGNSVTIEHLLTPSLPVAVKKQLADVALNTAKSLGATYTDVRIGRYLNQFISTRENKVQNIANTESFGVGVRVITKGTWGFAATNDVSVEGIKKATERAIAIAKANSKFQKEPVTLASNAGHGEVAWNTPIQKNSFEVPVSEKVDLLLRANGAALKNGASFASSNLFQVNEQKYFATTDGSYIDQDIHRIWPTFTVSVIDRASGKFKTRDAMSAPMGMGYEYMIPKNEDKLSGPAGMILYRNSYDIVEDASIAAKQAKEMHTAKSVEPGKYDLVLEPNHLGLTIHESIGHPLELDRILGYEANYAGTSFATLDKLKSGTFNYGSKQVNIIADKTQVGSLGAVGYDDEGVKCKKWDLIKDGEIAGMLVDVAYQSNTQEFWNSCVKICDENDYRMFGSFFDGKGQPSQVSAVSHGSSTSRFNGVNVINTGRTI